MTIELLFFTLMGVRVYMELQNVLTKVEQRYKETSDLLRKTNSRASPEYYYKAQGMNEVFMGAITKQHSVNLQSTKEQLAERTVFLASLRDTSDIEKQQGAIEALEFMVKLLEAKA